MKLHRFQTKNQKQSFKSLRIRALILFFLLLLCFAFLIYRSFFLQCIRGNELRAQAQEQYRREVFLGAKRGNIYDRNLHPLAIQLSSYSLYADPSILERRELAAESLSPILHISQGKILRKLESNSYFVWLKRQLSDPIADRIRSLHLRGLSFREEGKRFYPKGSLAAHVIGFVGLDNMGLDGIEKAYERYMQGNSQEVVSQKDRKGRNLNPQKIGYDEPTRGYDVVLTIDEVIQNIAEDEIQRACKRRYAKSGSVIIMNPETGEILALANYPTYDLNQASSISDDYKRNRAIRDLYEPGSIFKIVTAAAAINENLVTAEERIDCENGEYQIDGFTIHDSSKHEILTFSEVVEESSNIGIAKVVGRLGEGRLHDYVEAFGFTERTGVDLSDRSGFVRPVEQWTRRSMVAIPFGHEIAVTPLQMLCSTNAIANDGVMMKPYIVRAIMDNQKRLIEFLPQEGKTPISSRTARIMKEILIRAVENGTGEKARVNGYKVAGKTGTAQKASGAGGYVPGKYVSSFTGFVSSDDFTASMIVVVNEPQGGHMGSDVACPVFSEIATQVMQYLTIGQRSYANALKPVVLRH